MAMSRAAAAALLCAMAAVALLAGGAAAQDFPDELNSINFAFILGGPMKAVVEAQAQSALTTMEFINSVGFTQREDGTRDVTLVSFLYEAPNPNNDTAGTVTYGMRVPFLSMVPVPYIEITDLRIRFQVELQSVTSTFKQEDTSLAASVSAKANFLFGSASMTASVSSASQTKETGEVKRRYSLEVEVQARGGGMPGGTARMLELFESVIQTNVPPEELADA